ncbi:hypothetical protein, partial [Escherichia coli]|uniref:hypothetical protein n=1 Tax=Escherichia coli TaxID=562 RepID=UPI002075D8B0
HHQAGTSARKKHAAYPNLAQRLFFVSAIASLLQHSGSIQGTRKMRRIKSLRYLTLKHVRERVIAHLVIFVANAPFSVSGKLFNR